MEALSGQLKEVIFNSIEQFQPKPGASTMIALVSDLADGRITRQEYHIQWARLHAGIIAKAGPVLDPIPPGAVLYARWKAQTAAARAAGEPNSWTPQERTEAVRERATFNDWLGPITDRFDSMARTLDRLAPLGHEQDTSNLAILLRDGNHMHRHYMPQVRSGEIPWLPRHFGVHGNVLRAWEVLRDRVGPMLSGFSLDGTE